MLCHVSVQCYPGQSYAGLRATDPISVAFIDQAGGWVLPIMAYTEKVRPNGVPFEGLRYMKG